MNKIDNSTYSLSRNEYEKLKEKAVLGQNNNSSDTICSYFIIRERTMSLLVYQLSLWEGSKPSFLLYSDIDEEFVEHITGVPFEKFQEVG